jgi:sulfur carrier protein
MPAQGGQIKAFPGFPGTLSSFQNGACMTMRLTVNGDIYDIPEETTVAALLERWGVHEGRVAVLLNGDIVPAPERANRILEDGDSVEILTFAAGG